MSAEHDRLEIVAHRLPPPVDRSVQTLEQRTVHTARRDTGISLGRRDGLGRLHDQQALPSQREIDRFENLSATGGQSRTVRDKESRIAAYAGTKLLHALLAKVQAEQFG